MEPEKKELALDDLQQQHREYAEIIGIDNLLKLAEAFGGTSIYIPKKKELVKNQIYAAIYKEFDGSNLPELTQKYGVSKSTVYKIVQAKIGHCSWNIPGQRSLADWMNELSSEE